jgi:hypothetical protein
MQKAQLCCRKKKKSYRREGGIEPLARQRSLDLKSSPSASQDHHGIGESNAHLSQAVLTSLPLGKILLIWACQSGTI